MKTLVSGRLAVFGSFLGGELYPRTDAVLAELSALFDSRVDIVPARNGGVSKHHERISGISGFVGLAFTTIQDFWSLLRQRSRLREVDVIYVPYPAYLNIAMLQVALLGNSRKPLIVDAFLCLYDTVVGDRQLVPGGSLRARFVAWIEHRTLARADYILIDTPQQKELLAQQYGLPAAKFIVTPVGINEDLWRPLTPVPVEKEFSVLFWGTFIPLHGIATIVAAAELLEQASPFVKFTLIGDGQEGERIAQQLAEKPLGNLVWHRELLPATELYELVAKSHCALGIFGGSLKAASVVPYKVYQALAANRPLITRRGPAMDDLLQGEDAGGIQLVDPENPQALAEAIGQCIKSYADAVSGAPSNRSVYDRKMSRRQLRASLRDGLQL